MMKPRQLPIKNQRRRLSLESRHGPNLEITSNIVEQMINEQQELNFLNFFSEVKMPDTEEKLENERIQEEIKRSKLEQKLIKENERKEAKAEKAKEKANRPKKPKQKKKWEVEQAKIDRLVKDSNAKAESTVNIAKQTAEKITNDAKRDAELQARQQRDQLEQETRRHRADLQKNLKSEWEKANDEMKQAIVIFGTQLAKKILKKEITEKDNKELIDNFIDRVDISYDEFENEKKNLEKEIDEEND